ncbi:MBL fold metallo-hydrolase [Altererythrobacter aurantiacus]|uniref:beta-lactamase n=1 Tax=Parapontixanthobacter aurantiacus TaxID=1463599 RepID=A0A844ZBL6_9SPHN|nr:MBL fold metallo-hydrolase [Parapontixanthobacter aurantiacus]MXO85305.1 MBL fold metallo-hydrolase [Parapontixanthobacter aurantiacus]
MTLRLSAATVLSIGLLATPLQAQRDFSEVEITAEEVAPGIAVLFGAGGNLAVSYGEDGTILVDDQFAPLTAKIEAAITELGAKPVQYLINTHWHGDHTGGNENFAKKGAQIFAHHNVRSRLASGSQPEGNTPPAPAAALPVVTYGQGITMHVNGDTVDVMFVGGGHTNGDSIVRWREDNVVHMGDLYFNIPGFPYMDISSGGSVLDAMNSLDVILPMLDEETVVIPGHGTVSTKAELTAYRAQLGAMVDRVRELYEQGMTLEEAQAASPLAGFNEGEEGFKDADDFVEMVYESLGD